MKNRVPMWLPILTNYLWQCRGNLRQYLTIVNQISKTSLSDSLTGSPTWIREMLAHLNSISWGIISECSVLDGLDWARSECRGAWELELLLLYVLVLKLVRYIGYKSGKWTPLNIYYIWYANTVHDDVGIVFRSKRKLNKNKQTKILIDMHFVV